MQTVLKADLGNMEKRHKSGPTYHLTRHKIPLIALAHSNNQA